MQNNPTNKRLRILLPLLLVVVALVLIYLYYCPAATDSDELTLYGNVDLREVELAFVLQARIASLHAEEGDRVQAGQLLAEVEADRFSHTLAQYTAELEAARQQLAVMEHGSRPQEIRLAEAELASAQAAEKDARASYRRIMRLVKDKLASPQQQDDAHTAMQVAEAKTRVAQERLSLVQAGPREEEVAQARAKVAAAEAAVARARKDLDDTRLLAPAAGIVQTRILEVGDLAGPQQPVFTLAMTDPVWIRAYLSESDLGRVREGMPAEVRTDSFPDKVYAGRVGYISPSAEFTPKSVQTTDVRSSLVYQVRILVPDPKGELRLGMPATVTLRTEAASDAGG